jgi:hypothetical protein
MNCTVFASPPENLTKLQVVSAMYAYLMTSWEELPDQYKRSLSFDFVVGSEGEEAALNYLARLFMEYADLSFRRALVARRSRLGLDASDDSGSLIDLSRSTYRKVSIHT